MTRNYSIKSSYKPKSPTETVTANDATRYWTDDRIRKAYYYQYAAYKLIADLVITHDIGRVLDLGCGPAQKLIKLVAPHADDVVGVDRKEIIEYCRSKYKHGRFLTDDFQQPTYVPDGTFGLISAIDVIEHLPDPTRLLDYVKHYSGQNSWIVLSTPERDILRGTSCAHSPKSEHIREWNKTEFSQFLQDEGFNILSTNLCEHMKFNLSFEYFRKKIAPSFDTKHNLVVFAKLTVHE